jgi:hypothetical protein
VVERPRLPSPSHLGVRVSRTYRGGADRREVREADFHVSGAAGAAGAARIRAQGSAA